MEQEYLTASAKALRINLDQAVFGTFAEIGAGQEVARHFFKVGAAAGTIAKTMSAYDMTFSDEIYGRVGRYVSKERLISMLQHEYSLLVERLSEKRGKDTTFFAFSDTVAARNFTGTNECHGWLGIRFQSEPFSQPSNIVMHVRLTDRENLLQQQALGIIGVNLVYAAFYLRNNPKEIVSRLLDELSLERIEVDMIEVTGPAFEKVDNRLMALWLVEKGLTDATMFAPDGQVLQPSEVVRKHPVLIQRGSFRPVTHVNVDMLHGAKRQFMADPEMKDKEPVILFELTLHNLVRAGVLNEADFLARADSISALGHIVMISDYPEYYRLSAFFRRYTKEPIAMVVGINALMQILDPSFYKSLEGGILEAVGRLFTAGVQLYVYPMTREGWIKYCKRTGQPISESDVAHLPELISADNLIAGPHLEHLYKHLLSAGWILPIEDVNKAHLSIFSDEVLAKIKAGDASWESDVPAPTAAVIHKLGQSVLSALS